jgi:hypothetical protein
MRIQNPGFFLPNCYFDFLVGEQVMEVTTPLDPDPDQLVRGTDPASDPDLLFAVFYLLMVSCG